MSFNMWEDAFIQQIYDFMFKNATPKCKTCCYFKNGMSFLLGEFEKIQKNT